MIPHSEKNGLLRDWQRRVADAINGAVDVENDTYSPTWDNLTPGEANDARYTWVGKMHSGARGILTISFTVELGSVDGTGVTFSLPSGYSQGLVTASGYLVLPGGWSTNNTACYGYCTYGSGGTVALLTSSVGTGYLQRSSISTTVPAAWTSSHFIRGSVACPAIRD